MDVGGHLIGQTSPALPFLQGLTLLSLHGDVFLVILGRIQHAKFKTNEKLYKLLKLPIIYIAYSPIVWQHNLDDNTLCHSNLTVTFEETRKCCKCCGKVFTLLILENWFCRHKNGNANKKKKLFRINDGIRIESK